MLCLHLLDCRCDGRPLLDHVRVARHDRLHGPVVVDQAHDQREPVPTRLLRRPFDVQTAPDGPAALPSARLATGASVVSGAGYDAIDADMVDMETFAVVRAAARFDVPVLGLRGVSDGRADEMKPRPESGRVERTVEDDWIVIAASGRDFEQAETILTVEEAAGLRLFIGKANCTQCHNSPLFTNNDFHNTGVPAVSDLPEDTGRAVGAQQVLADARARDAETPPCPTVR